MGRAISVETQDNLSDAPSFPKLESAVDHDPLSHGEDHRSRPREATLDYEKLLGRFGKQLRERCLPFAPIPQTVRPRRNIYIRGEPTEHTYVVCEGWACRVARLLDGRRQILSLLLPGDLFSPMSPFQSSLEFYVEAITEVRYAAIKNTDLRAKLEEDPALLASFMELCVAEMNDAHQRLIDLGQRLAEERIALLILQLMERLDARGMVNNQSFEFPLRQLQIADAVGLTPVHVSRVMSLLRNSGLIETHNGVLHIRDLAKLRRLSGLR